MPISRWKVTNGYRNSLFVTYPQYQLHYPKGEIVVPSKSAPGIWVFDTRESAERYAEKFKYCFPEILRVLPIGRAIKLKRYRPRSFGHITIKAFWNYLAETIRHSDNEINLSMHLCCAAIANLDGTLIYPAVRVMD
jgi:hypothetical protein